LTLLERVLVETEDSFSSAAFFSGSFRFPLVVVLVTFVVEGFVFFFLPFVVFVGVEVSSEGVEITFDETNILDKNEN
jgi:hypothetical protein